RSKKIFSAGRCWVNTSGMVNRMSQIGVHKRFAGWPLASRRILDGYKDRIDAGQQLGIRDLHDPPRLLLIIQMERAQADRARLVVESLTPYLKRFVVPGGFIQIKRVEDELLVVGEENAPVRLLPI